eukprot:g17068.t1
MKFKVVFNPRVADYVGDLIDALFNSGASSQTGKSKSQSYIMLTFSPQRSFVSLSEYAPDMFFVELKNSALYRSYRGESAEADNRICLTLKAGVFAQTLKKGKACSGGGNQILKVVGGAGRGGGGGGGGGEAPGTSRPSGPQLAAQQGGRGAAAAQAGAEVGGVGGGAGAEEIVELRLCKDASMGNTPALMVKKTLPYLTEPMTTLIPCRVVYDVEEIVTLPDFSTPDGVESCEITITDAINPLRTVLDKFKSLHVERIDLYGEKERAHTQLIAKAITSVDSCFEELQCFFKYHIHNTERLESARAVLSLKTLAPNLAKLVALPGEIPNLQLKLSAKFAVVFALLEDGIGVVTSFNTGLTN